MTPNEEFKFVFEVFYGKKSKLNLLGKVCLFPFIASWAGMIWLLEFLFTKKVKKPQVAYYTTDGHKLAPHPNMTDADLKDFEDWSEEVTGIKIKRRSP